MSCIITETAVCTSLSLNANVILAVPVKYLGLFLSSYLSDPVSDQTYSPSSFSWIHLSIDSLRRSGNVSFHQSEREKFVRYTV